MGCTRAIIALCCAGIVVLPLLGLLFRLQPQFIHGLRVDPQRAEMNCYYATACYGAVLLLTLAARAIKTSKRMSDGDLASLSGFQPKTKPNLPMSARTSSSSFDVESEALKFDEPHDMRRSSKEKNTPTAF